MNDQPCPCCGHDQVAVEMVIKDEFEENETLKANVAALEARCAKLESAGNNLQSVVLELRGMLETQDPERLYQAFEPHYGTLAELINDWIAAR